MLLISRSEARMNSPQPCSLERLGSNAVLTHLDDLCVVHVGGKSASPAQTRQIGERLLAFVEQGQCRKLVISFEGVENIYGFLMDRPPIDATPPARREVGMGHSGRSSASSDLWLG